MIQRRIAGWTLGMILLLTGCAGPGPAEVTEPLISTEDSTSSTETEEGTAVFSYWTEPQEVQMTDELRQRLVSHFQPVAAEGTLLNEGRSPEGIRFTPDPGVQYQRIEGFGSSGCWWACFSDVWEETQLDEALMLLYSREYGIGLTTFRHNIGGGTPEGFGGKGATKCVEVFPGYYDIAADAPGMAVLQKLQSLGVDYFTLFMNSPPARMTESGSTLGALDGGSNLRRECYEEYAVYCADVVELYTRAGIPVKYISPINEPQWSWKAATYQEGCHYEYADVAKLDELLALELDRRGLDTRVSIPETAAWYDDIYSRYLVSTIFFNKELCGRIDHLAGHSYGSKAVHKQSLAAYYSQMGIDLPIHQTEWCLEDGDILSVSRVIHEDLTILNCTLWEYWVGVEPPESGKNGGALVYVDPSGSVILNAQGALVGQYARFITGAVRINLEMSTEAAGIYGTAYVKDGKTILVLTNETEQEQQVCFAGLSGIGKAWQTDETLRLQYIGDVNASFGWSLAPRSVTTVVFE